MSGWDERYGGAGYAYGTEPNDFLVEVAGRLPDGPVLCLAEGQGRNAVWLAEHGRDVTAVDGSDVGLEKARELAATRGVEIVTIHADLTQFAIEPGRWAGIVSIFGHLPPALRQQVHAACVNGLRPGGAMILEAYTPDQIGRGTGGPPVAELMMTAAGLRSEFAGLHFEILEEKLRMIAEGPLHDGEGAVVQMLAFRSEAG